MSERYLTKSFAAVILTRKNQDKTEILLQKRSANVPGAGNYDCSATGHIEAGESLTACAKREALEEIGISFDENSIIFKTVIHSADAGAYFGLIIFIEKFKGNPKVCETEKCIGLEWFDIENLPQNFWPATTTEAIKNFREKIFYSEIGWN